MPKDALSCIRNKECDDDYPQSWYPVARSCDLKKGQQKAVTLFAADWVLFRTESGSISFLKRHCCHMGADLCQGKVVKETIECPLHAWRFDVSGKCVHIPHIKSALPERKIVHLPCEEKYGIIFVFWGDQALFSIPSPPDLVAPKIFSPALTEEFESSYQVFGLNSFDTQHFKHVHNRQFVDKPEIYQSDNYALRINFKVKIYQKKRWVDYILSSKRDTFKLSVECWGGNFLTLKNHDFNSYAIVVLQPITKFKSKAYLVTLKEQQGKSIVFDRLTLMVTSWLVRNFLMADLKATKNIHLHQVGLVDELDSGAYKFWSFFNSLPRITTLATSTIPAISIKGE